MGKIFTARLLFVLLFCLFAVCNIRAYAGDDSRQYRWWWNTAYTLSHKGWGDTRETVQMVELLPRFEYFLTDILGSGWYQGRHSLFVEVPLGLVVDPDTAPMVGLTFLGVWTFTGFDKVQPYLLGGGGLVYTSADIPGMGSELNGNYQFGGGVRFSTGAAWSWSFEYRFSHISNAGTASPNDPLNMSRFVLGIEF